MDYKITAPNKNYTGESAGVNFINGEGIAKDGKSVEWFREKGYEVEPMEEKESGEDKPAKGRTKAKPEDKKDKEDGKPEGEAEGSDGK